MQHPRLLLNPVAVSQPENKTKQFDKLRDGNVRVDDKFLFFCGTGSQLVQPTPHQNIRTLLALFTEATAQFRSRDFDGDRDLLMKYPSFYFINVGRRNWQASGL